MKGRYSYAVTVSDEALVVKNTDTRTGAYCSFTYDGSDRLSRLSRVVRRGKRKTRKLHRSSRRNNVVRV